MSTEISNNNKKKPFYTSLMFQLVVGLSLGALVGIFWPDIGAKLNPLASAFVKLIKMVASLIVFLTIVTGLAQMNKGAGVGKLGTIAVVYFEVVSTLALILGVIIANVFEPGKGLLIQGDAQAVTDQIRAPLSGVDLLLSIIPKTVVDALASGIMLQVLLVSLLFGYALFSLGEKAKPVTSFLCIMSDATFKVVGVILKVAPIGVFGAMAYMLGRYGISSLIPLLKLVGLVYCGCLFIMLVNYNIIALLTKFNYFKFVKYVKEELMIAFTTTSSEAALPGLMKKLENAGCNKVSVGFLLPLGYSLNLEGASIYLTLSSLFLAQAAGIDLGWGQQFALVFLFFLTSKGVAGVTGGAFVTLSASLLMFPEIPLEGLAVILGVDRIMDAMRTTTNVLGNGVATMAISYWNGTREDVPYGSKD